MDSPALLKAADRFVRGLLPVVLESVGQAVDAHDLRGLAELDCNRAAILACGLLEAIWSGGRDRGGAVRWCEKAVWAAVAGDALAFRRNVDYAHAALREGLHNPSNPTN